MAELLYAPSVKNRRRRIALAASALGVPFHVMAQISLVDPGELHAALKSIAGGRLFPDPEVDG